jgi:hypothetical protein
MTQSPKRNKFSILLTGYLLIWGAFFGYRTFQVLTMEITDGATMGRIRQGFTEDVPKSHGGTGKYHGEYIRVQLHFRYKRNPEDTGIWYDATPQALSFNEYPNVQKTRIIFPKGSPESATIFSLEEFWFPAPYMITLLGITVLWSIGYIVAYLKPWRIMSE